MTYALEDSTALAMAKHVDDATWVILRYLSSQFGSYKQAPDDHPLWEATKLLSDVAFHLPSDWEEEDDA